MEITFALDEIQSVAKQIFEASRGGRCFAFFAEMGVGKTTLINALCKQLGVQDNTSSPTYSIINEYQSVNGDIIVHMDWYRLKNENDALNTGVEDYILGGQYCFIEWPERAQGLLPANHVRVDIELMANEDRKLQLRIN